MQAGWGKKKQKSHRKTKDSRRRRRSRRKGGGGGWKRTKEKEEKKEADQKKRPRKKKLRKRKKIFLNLFFSAIRNLLNGRRHALPSLFPLIAACKFLLSDISNGIICDVDLRLITAKLFAWLCAFYFGRDVVCLLPSCTSRWKTAGHQLTASLRLTDPPPLTPSHGWFCLPRIPKQS